MNITYLHLFGYVLGVWVYLNSLYNEANLPFVIVLNGAHRRK